MRNESRKTTLRRIIAAAFIIAPLVIFISAQEKGAEIESTETFIFPMERKSLKLFGSAANTSLSNSDEDLIQIVVPDDLEARAELIDQNEVTNREIPPHLFGGDWNPPRWRHAKCLLQLRKQINILAPARNKDDDGFIGNCAHCCVSLNNSDHCPWVQDDVGIVTAYDITHSPQTGLDCEVLVQELLKSKDSRIKYIIWDRHIYNSDSIAGAPPWTKRKYTGKNPHTAHCHISVLPSKAKFDATNDWEISKVVTN